MWSTDVNTNSFCELHVHVLAPSDKLPIKTIALCTPKKWYTILFYNRENVYDTELYCNTPLPVEGSDMCHCLRMSTLSVR